MHCKYSLYSYIGALLKFDNKATRFNIKSINKKLVVYYKLFMLCTFVGQYKYRQAYYVPLSYIYTAINNIRRCKEFIKSFINLHIGI